MQRISSERASPMSINSGPYILPVTVLNVLRIFLMLEIPRNPMPRNLRLLPLRGFQPLIVGAFWQGKLSPVAERFLEEARKRARWLASGPKSAS